MNTKEIVVEKYKKLIWGIFPVIFLFCVILIQCQQISEKGANVAAEKRGLNVLKGEFMAADNADKVIDIVKSSENIKEAVESLKQKFDLSQHQAQAVIHMPLSKLTISERDKRAKEIAYIEKKMMENKGTALLEDAMVNVVTLVLKKGPIQDRINLPGIVVPWVKLDVSAEVRGIITKKKAVLGTYINKGDIIAQIDSRDYRNTLKAATASYNTALASKNRMQKLIKEKLATRAQLDQAISMVENARAQMDGATLSLERCTIKSPISGYVNNLFFEKGQYINASQKVAEVIQIERVKVDIGIPESDVNDVRNVEDFEVKIEALEGKVFQAKKYFLSQSTDPMARLYNLELVMENSQGNILPDMFCRVKIVKKEVAEAIILPLYSIISLDDAHFVYVVKDGIVRSRDIEPGIMEGFRIEVKKGLEPGEHVVVVGQRSINHGQKVNIIQTVTRMEDLAR